MGSYTWSLRLSSTQCFWVSSCHSMYQYLVPFYCLTRFHRRSLLLLFIHLPVDGHLGCFYFSTVANDAMDICVQFSWVSIQKRNCWVRVLLRTWLTVSQSGCISLPSYQQHVKLHPVILWCHIWAKLIQSLLKLCRLVLSLQFSSSNRSHTQNVFARAPLCFGFPVRLLRDKSLKNLRSSLMCWLESIFHLPEVSAKVSTCPWLLLQASFSWQFPDLFSVWNSCNFSNIYCLERLWIRKFYFSNLPICGSFTVLFACLSLLLLQAPRRILYLQYSV